MFMGLESRNTAIVGGMSEWIPQRLSFLSSEEAFMLSTQLAALPKNYFRMRLRELIKAYGNSSRTSANNPQPLLQLSGMRMSAYGPS